MHVSLDGFVSGPNGEMDWIRLGDDMWDYVQQVTATSDTALYGEVTYHMMEGYWPTAGEKPNASSHDINHSRWANAAKKIVFSKTLEKTNWDNTEIVRELKVEEIQKLKMEDGKNMIMFGSPTLAHSFMMLGLIDEYWLNVNPIILGEGKSLYKDIHNKIPLELMDTKVLSSGVVALKYHFNKGDSLK